MELRTQHLFNIKFNTRRFRNSFITYNSLKIVPKKFCKVATAKDYMTQVESSFEFQKIDSKDVFKLTNKLNLRKASGCDKISNRLLKISGPYIYEALTNLFNLSLTTNKFPTRWNIAKVFPLHKTEERDNANNYRPISVLSSIARLFERLVYNQMYAYLSKHRLINTRQSGFRSLHSTMTALLDMTNQWCFNIDKGMLNGVIFLDLKKAFDTIDHEILQMKLACYGLKECSLGCPCDNWGTFLNIILKTLKRTWLDEYSGNEDRTFYKSDHPSTRPELVKSPPESVVDSKQGIASLSEKCNDTEPSSPEFKPSVDKTKPDLTTTLLEMNQQLVSAMKQGTETTTVMKAMLQRQGIPKPQPMKFRGDPAQFHVVKKRVEVWLNES
ncbi:Hypothetical predicted protein [Paramuricea clavata]|uniref:Reverse transcriptase domain-containing protein n=1 Tax=Paramuricea clavata TaxID=317549 RepID=A0A6S7ISK3_PARCT|nr:Hypothetical predicted protein [Paramuricea clavata]